MLRYVISFLALLFSTQLLAYYPITPRPLRKMVIESEYIIKGKVLDLGRINKNEKDYDSWESDFAIIEVQELLQGTLTVSQVKVFFSSGMICPAPGVFYKEEEVLAFLDKKEKGDGYSVHALSYGVKHGLTHEGFQFYTKRIHEMQEILALSKGPSREEKTLEWLVSCAEQKPTRWEGVYELSPASDFMYYYDREEPQLKEKDLNSQQRKRLFNALLKTDSLEYDDLPLVDITKGIDDDALLALLKNGLTKVDTMYLWPAEFIMKRIVTFTANTDLADLYKKFVSLSSWEEEENQERSKLYLSFITKMEGVKRK